MNLFDILGPVMVGPQQFSYCGSGPDRLYFRKITSGPCGEGGNLLHGSFATTGIGHGTDKALIAGLLGMRTDDIRIPDSFFLAKKGGMEFSFSTITRKMPIQYGGSAADRRTWAENRSAGGFLGGGRILIAKLDGIEVNFSAEKPTLIVHNVDQPGHVAQVTSMLAEKQVNIATLQLYRDKRGGYAVMVIETDQEVPEESVAWLEQLDGIIKVTYINVEE